MSYCFKISILAAEICKNALFLLKNYCKNRLALGLRPHATLTPFSPNPQASAAGGKILVTPLPDIMFKR